VTDRVDIGLLKVSETAGRQRLDQTISKLSDVIKQGLTGTAGNFRFGVTSLRQCTSGYAVDTGCSIGTTVAAGPELDALISAAASAAVTRECEDTGNVAARNRITYWLLLAVTAFVRF